MILEVDNVELSFSEKRILSGIYLKAETGKVTAILGSNGSGKTSLFQIIFGTLKPKYKLVRINGKAQLKPLFLGKQAKYLPQHNFVPAVLRISTLFKNFDLNWEFFIDQFNGFSKYENTRFRLLSGGERRIIETYLILKSKSKIVLLDEPFSHIAPLFVEKIKTIIAEEKKHKIIILTDHIYDEVIEIADDLYLLKNGHTKFIENIKDLERYHYLSVESVID